MKLTDVALKNKVTTYLIFITLLLVGYMSYEKSEKSEDPGFTVKVALITTNWPGATSKQMADLVSKKIADQIQNIETLDYVDSKNIPGESNVYVNIKSGNRDLVPIWQELRNRINTFVVPALPEGVQTPIINTYFGDIYGTLLTISGDSYSYEELYKTAENLKAKLLFSVPQIGRIDISGVQNEVIYVKVDNERLSQSKISMSNIIETLQNVNVIENGGDVVSDDYRIKISPTGNFKNIKDIENTIITDSNGQNAIYLKEIAKVEKTYQDPSDYMISYNGDKAITLGVSLGDKEDVLVMSKGIKSVLKDFKSKLPIGIEVGQIYYQPDLVQDKVTSFIANLVQAIVTIVIVMLLCLGLRSGLIVAALTPTSIAFTIIGLYYLGYGINQITLAGLIIALGMLVDNAVVMSENIMVLMQEGKSRMDACLESGKMLAVPLLVSSLTTIVAFSPIILNKENMGEYVGPLTIVVLLALLGSWLINQTLIPLLCYDFLKVKSGSKQNMDSKPYLIYRKVLTTLLKNKKISICATIGAFCLGLVLLGVVPKNFMPDSTDPVMSTYIRMPKGTDINRTAEVVNDLNEFIKKNYSTGEQEPLSPSLWNYITTGGTDKKYKKQGILSWGIFIGGGAPKYSTSYQPETRLPEYAYVMYNVTDYRIIKKLSSEINLYMQSKYPGIDITTKGMGSGVSLEKDLGYVFVSDNVELLKKVSKEFEEKIKTVKGIRAVSNNWGNDVPRITININQEKAKKAGLSNSVVGKTLQFILQGTNATVYRNFEAPPKSTIIPVMLKGSRSYKDDITNIETIQFMTPSGVSVPLNQIADIKVEYVPDFVYTRDMSYGIEVDAGIQDGYTPPEVNDEIIPWLTEKLKEWGPEIKYYPAGIMKTSSENEGALFQAVPTALLVMFLLVIGQFNSVKKGLSIMLVIPLSIPGIAVGLLCTNTQLGFMAIIGIISLAGVVLNHAIILVDKMTIEKDDIGRNDQDAIVFGCQSRLRPIFLTVATTLMGLMPLYFFGGPLFQPLAVVLIFGLATDTVLALGIIPVIYALFFKVDFKDYVYDGKKLEMESKE